MFFLTFLRFIPKKDGRGDPICYNQRLDICSCFEALHYFWSFKSKQMYLGEWNIPERFLLMQEIWLTSEIDSFFHYFKGFHIHPRCRVPFPVSPSNCSPFRLGPGEATANRGECHGKNQKLGNRSGIFRIKPRKLLDKECQLVRMDPRLLFSWEMLADTRPDTK